MFMTSASIGPSESCWSFAEDKESDQSNETAWLVFSCSKFVIHYKMKCNLTVNLSKIFMREFGGKFRNKTGYGAMILMQIGK